MVDQPPVAEPPVAEEPPVVVDPPMDGYTTNGGMDDGSDDEDEDEYWRNGSERANEYRRNVFEYLKANKRGGSGGDKDNPFGGY
ncbi:hypothetical protein [Rosistilla oblonga]|uniref:hypothetical protein n=1 Tax=Rosistilla oblonga TaxID=2527990 RepID=UPI003A974E76